MTAPRILYVEDDAMVRGSMARLLRTYGYQVTEATDGRHASEILAAETHAAFDVVVSDLEMPMIRGDELCLVVKERMKSMPFILMSGRPDVHEMGRSCKADRTFWKPVSISELEPAIQELTGKSLEPKL